MRLIKSLAKWTVYLVIGFIGLLATGVLVLNLYKDRILTKINTKLQETVEGDVKIGDYSVSMLHAFPNLSLSLKEIYLHGPRFEHYHKPFLQAEHVHINIVPHRLLFREIEVSSVDVEQGEIFIFKTRDGFSNTDVLKSRNGSGTGRQQQPAVIDLHRINLKDVKFTFHDSLKLKHLGVDLHRTQNLVRIAANQVTQIETRGNMTFHGLMLNAEKGSFLRNINALAELNLELDSTFRNLNVLPSRLIFDKSTVLLSGNFHLGDKRHFELSISSHNVDHAEAQQIVHDTLAAKIGKFSAAGPIKIDVQVKGIMQAGVKPQVDARFSIHDTQVTGSKLQADHVSLNGTFMNHVNADVPNDDNNARLHFEKFKGLVDHIPVEATATLTDMKDPYLELKAVFDTPLKNLNANFDSTLAKFKGGHFRSSFTYSGKLREYMDETVTEYKGKLSGQATIANGALDYNRRKFRINNVNAVFDFTEKEFSIRSLNFAVNKNDIAITGRVADFIPFFVQPDGSTHVKLSIVSPRIDLTGITKPQMMISKQKAKARQARSRKKMVDIVDRLNEEIDLDVTFNIAQFVNRNFKASKVKGQLLLTNNQLHLKDLSMNFGGGSVSLNTQIANVSNKISPIHIKAKAHDVALKSFFHAFNDFNQKTFTHEKIDGKLNLDIDLRSAITETLDLQMTNLDGRAVFTINSMRLSNFEPIQRLSNFLMKDRDFSDVAFNDIHSTVDMSGTKMNVSRMEVESTVLSMFIEGIYDLGDSTDLAVQVPLSNLKKRDQLIPPENIGTDSRVGPSVYLRVRTDKDGKTVISYDPFKKFRRQNKSKKNVTADAP